MKATFLKNAHVCTRDESNIWTQSKTTEDENSAVFLRCHVHYLQPHHTGMTLRRKLITEQTACIKRVKPIA